MTSRSPSVEPRFVPVRTPLLERVASSGPVRHGNRLRRVLAR
jgi:hypothetical protein